MPEIYRYCRGCGGGEHWRAAGKSAREARRDTWGPLIIDKSASKVALCHNKLMRYCGSADITNNVTPDHKCDKNMVFDVISTSHVPRDRHVRTISIFVE